MKQYTKEDAVKGNRPILKVNILDKYAISDKRVPRIDILTNEVLPGINYDDSNENKTEGR